MKVRLGFRLVALPVTSMLALLMPSFDFRLRVGIPHGHWKTTTFVACA